MQESPTELIAQAEQALVNEEWAAALDRFNRALALLGHVTRGPEAVHLAEANNGRGVALLELHRYAEAIKALEAALFLKPDLSGAYFNLGLAWEGLGHLETALHNYNKAIELEPMDAEAYFRRGGIWFAMEKFDKTVEDATRAIELHQGDGGQVITGPYIARGLALHRLERYDESLADYTRAQNADPRGAVEAFFYRALVFIDRGEALPARADMQAYLSLTDDLEGVLAEQAREIIAELDKHQ